ncbi:MAG: 1-deoxy-D-xylulose-5-phosphate reductoisomerase [Clostridiales bacterium]|nr:1-deoxy-D-xylulose-5-phosphate reductoisomerase [Clostridiales bacterium]
MIKVGIFGSGGSIGTQALELIAQSECLKAEVLVTNSNLDLLISQANRFHPSAVGLLSTANYDRQGLGKLANIKFAAGEEAYALCDSCDVILFCAVGTDILPALIRYVRLGKKIALANKECLVSAGEIIMDMAAKSGAQIIPVDSEHSAVWQCLRAGKADEVQKIVLTASGGRYYTYSIDKLKTVTPDEAIRHPNWKMGKKISVDSATMMNKALELIEARWLFGTKNVDYVIHPESIIHSMVVFRDGAVMAQLSQPDMRLPISVALSYPDRGLSGIKNFEFDRTLSFLPKREDVFFAPRLAMECVEKGGTSGTILDASNEGAVRLFMQGKIAFTDIAEIVKNVMTSAQIVYGASLSDIIELHKSTVNEVIKKYGH